ncbi:hypothetical protein [Streptococcus saliviloxodontae]|uniref:Uncharacterized protein (DUF697 family) n=1 Tax=Streptococcus saliviloxodontae TaxID=1349416 RepID=A0ABS2PJ40_9STRE|nr:hypothetical protein [Streptococcus saliviloxodontae]MBM7635449.1 uncharacterized protein (DUF697 family) [Streptococcus saliviloxodontae]
MKKSKSLILTSLLLGAFGVQLSHPQLVTPLPNSIVYATTNNESENTAEIAVKTLEDSQTRNNLAKAKETVATLDSSSNKEKLEDRITAVEQAITIKEAKEAVKRLEDKQNRNNLTSAQTASDQVKDAGTYLDLTNRINKVSQAITIKEAQTAVKYLEDHQTRDNIAPAQEATNRVSDSGTVANLENRINAVQNAINIREAQTAVKRLEDHQTRDNIAPAQEATNRVSDSGTIANLENRINAVQNAISIREAEAQAEANAEIAVKHLEDNQNRENQANAQAVVNSVNDANKKAAWQHRINLVDAAISTKEEQVAQAAAAQAAQEAQAASRAQVRSSSGYSRDYRGRWHRSNGQYASKAEIAAAGLPW